MQNKAAEKIGNRTIVAESRIQGHRSSWKYYSQDEAFGLKVLCTVRVSKILFKFQCTIYYRSVRETLRC